MRLPPLSCVTLFVVFITEEVWSSGLLSTADQRTINGVRSSVRDVARQFLNLNEGTWTNRVYLNNYPVDEFVDPLLVSDKETIPKPTFAWLRRHFHYFISLEKNGSNQRWYAGLQVPFRRYGLKVSVQTGTKEKFSKWAAERGYGGVHEPVTIIFATLNGSLHQANTSEPTTKVFFLFSHFHDGDNTTDVQNKFSGLVALYETARLISFSKFTPKKTIVFVVLDRKHNAKCATTFFMHSYLENLNSDIKTSFGGALILFTYNKNLDGEDYYHLFSRLSPDGAHDEPISNKHNSLVVYQLGRKPLNLEGFWKKLEHSNVRLFNLRVIEREGIENESPFENSVAATIYKSSRAFHTTQPIMVLSDISGNRSSADLCNTSKCVTIRGEKLNHKAMQLLFTATSVAVLTTLEITESKFIHPK